jgi:predicted DNA-binding protein (MmcQ/YjbR family)
MSDDDVGRLRAICLALPEAEERLTWGETNFRVRDKIFAVVGSDSVVLKAPPGVQAILVGADAERFFVPQYVGHKGWVGIRLTGAPDWAEIADLIKRSYRLIAPKRLAERMG